MKWFDLFHGEGVQVIRAAVFGHTASAANHRASPGPALHGKDAAEAVYKKSIEFDYGIIVDTDNKTPGKTIKDIIHVLKPKYEEVSQALKRILGYKPIRMNTYDRLI